MNTHWNQPWQEEMFEEGADEAAHHRDRLQEEHMYLEALARCARAGADPQDLETLAFGLGVAREFERVRP